MPASEATPITDREFARRFDRGEISPADFHHHEHLRLAWAYLRERETADAAATRMCKAIRSFAAKAGSPGKYHETMTIFWVHLVATARESGVEKEFSEVLPSHPQFLDRNAPLKFYSRERLFSDAARSGWLPPDLGRLDFAPSDTSPATFGLNLNSQSSQPCHSA